MILASITAAYAETVGANGIALGIQATDSYSYWDTTPDFYKAVESVLMLNRKNRIYFVPAFLNLSKADEIMLGVEMGVKFHSTWTCYQPLRVDKDDPGHVARGKAAYVPCGKCPSCAERRAAFQKLGIEDDGLRVRVIGDLD
jgi:7-cyano-7-deazaguanine synthase